MSLVSLVVILIVAWAALWVARTLIGLCQAPALVATNLHVIAVILVVWWIAQSLGVSIPPLRVR